MRSYRPSRAWRCRVLAALGLAVALSAAGDAAASATNSSQKASSVVYGGDLTTSTNDEGPWSPVFNPFSPSYNWAMGFGAIYESLLMADPKTNTYTPWLATSYSWGDGGDVLKFQIRNGISWSNGERFKASDVVFTFNLEKSITTESGGTSQLLSATASGNWVTLHYDSPQYVNFDTIALNTPIVPPFTFSGVGDPLKFEDSHPIGTGPFVLASVSPQYITYTRNPNYWQKGKPYADEVQDVASDSNSTMEALLITHQVDYSGVFTSDIFKTFVDRDPSKNVVYTPPDGTVSLVLNETDALFQNVKVREAINLAVDRSSLNNIGESGAEPPASQSGLSGSATTPFILSQYRPALQQDIGKARSLLQSAGYTLSNGKLRPSGGGSQVGFSLQFPAAYSDWMTDCSIIEQNLTHIGIAVNCDGVPGQSFNANQSDGEFQANFEIFVGPTPYDEFNPVFAVPSSGLPAIGKPNDNLDTERFVSPQAQSELKALQSMNPADVAAQKAADTVLEKIMVNDVPVIPLFESTYHTDFVNGPFYGWPSKNNPYMCTYCGAYQEQLLLAAHER